MPKIGIIGATGYTAAELIELLLRHPDAEIVSLTSRSQAGLPVSACHSRLKNRLDLEFTELNVESFASEVEFAFCCLPHAAASPVVKQLVENDVPVVDFSADYRLDDVSAYDRHYGSPHADPARIPDVPYGLPELFREQIKSASLVANPGCFPTSAILPLAPLLRAELIDPTDIIVDSKTGISGAGRTAKLKFHYPECNESITAYGIGTHRHAPEMDTILNRFCDAKTNIVFTPHLAPMTRGILSTIYVRPSGDLDTLKQQLTQFYAQEEFVRVVESIPKTGSVKGTNYCDIGLYASGDRVVLVCAIDNLIKGASGAAVQNFNLMCGLPEQTGLAD